MIRVCLVEDQMLVRQGLRTLLELVGDIQVVGEATDGEEATRLIPELGPDVVLLDMKLPKLDGIGVMKKLKERRILPPTIVLTTFNDDAYVLEGIRCGAKGFMLKDVSLEQLTDAVRTVANGGTRFQPVVTQRILEGLENLPNDFESLEPPDPLTEREVEIVRLMTGGYSNREIAEALSVAEGTVKNHISNILSKFGVRDRTRAVLKAVELGYVS